MSWSDLLSAVNNEAESTEDAGERIFKHLKSFPPKIKQPMGKDEYVSISEMYKLCPREEVLASREEIIREEVLPPSLRITFDIGHALHSMYRDLFYGPKGDWLGAWECKRCGWSTDDDGISAPSTKTGGRPLLSKMPDQCGKCGAYSAVPCSKCGSWCYSKCERCGNPRDGLSKEFVTDNNDSGIIVFKEWNVSDDELMMKGHPDGWRRISKSKIILSDIKTHTSNGFSKVNTVQFGHDRQVMAYQHCTLYKEGEVLYANKSPWGDSSNFLRGIRVDFNRKVFDSEIKAPLLQLREGLNGGKLPPRQCESSSCSKAKGCALAKICFSN